MGRESAALSSCPRDRRHGWLNKWRAPGCCGRMSLRSVLGIEHAGTLKVAFRDLPHPLLPAPQSGLFASAAHQPCWYQESAQLQEEFSVAMVGPTLCGVQSPAPQPEARADVLDTWKPGTQASLACGRGISGAQACSQV